MSARVALLQQQVRPLPEPAVEDEAPGAPVLIDPAWPSTRQALARVYNRIGTQIEQMANEVGIDVPAVLAVWYVESSGRLHVPSKAVIRFENHILFNQWGQHNPGTYDAHFQHGGRPPATADSCRGSSGEFASWKCHRWRRDTSQPFVGCHQGQAQEYEVLEFARELSGDEIALQCISIGGCQVMGFNYGKLGFDSPKEMFDAFQESELAQVRGFFSFCKRTGAGEAITALQQADWATFARIYNGSGNVAYYADAIRLAEAEARQFWTADRQSVPSTNGAVEDLLDHARQLKGVVYEINLPNYPRVPGGRGFGKKYPGLDKGLDCSGYVLNVLQHSGRLKHLDPDYTGCDALWTYCEPIPQRAAVPGDLVFFKGTYDTGGMSHIGIVTEAGGTAMISAREPHVGEDSLSGTTWTKFLAGFGRLR
jgi:cell wall-associated NlpC family hydrolase